MFKTLVLAAALAAPTPQALYAVEPNQELTQQEYEEIVNQINSGYDTPIVASAIIKFKSSNLYEANLEKLSLQQTKAKIESIIYSAQFTREEKIQIGRAIIRNYAYENFFSNLGLDISHKVEDSTVISNEDIVNPITQSPLRIRTNDGSSHTMKQTGNYGISSTWEKFRPGEEVYNFSTKSIFETFIALIGKSKAFSDVKKTFDNTYNQIIIYNPALALSSPEAPNIDGKFKEILESFSTQLKTYIDSINMDANSKAQLLNMEFVGDILNTNSFIGQNDDETYEKLMSSKLGQVVFGSSATGNISNYKSLTGATAAIVKHSLMVAALVQIKGELDRWQSINSEQITKILSINNGKLLDEDDEYKNLIGIYSQLFNRSGQLTRPVQIRIYGDLFKHAILIRGGISSSNAWNLLQNFKINTLTYDDSRFRHDIVVKSLNQIYAIPGSGIRIISEEKPLGGSHMVGNWDASSKNALYADPHPVRWSGSNANIFVSLWSKINGVEEEWTGGIDMHENDHDHDVDVKNYHTVHISRGSCSDEWIPNDKSDYPAMIHRSVCTSDYVDENRWEKNEFIAVPINKLEWDESVNDIFQQVDQFKLLFRWTRDDTSYEETTFSELRNRIIKQYHSIHEKLVRAIADPAKYSNFWQGHYDPTQTYRFTIELKKIDLGDVRFNTYDDAGWDATHSDLFSFQNAEAYWEVKLVSTKA